MERLLALARGGLSAGGAGGGGSGGDPDRASGASSVGGCDQREALARRLAEGLAGGLAAEPTSPTDRRAWPAIFLVLLDLQAGSPTLPAAALNRKNLSNTSSKGVLKTIFEPAGPIRNMSNYPTYLGICQ